LTEKNELKTIIKQGNVFDVDIYSPKEENSTQMIRIWGDNMIHSGSMRTKFKFKIKEDLKKTQNKLL
jgi:hypothetical protein